MIKGGKVDLPVTSEDFLTSRIILIVLQVCVTLYTI